MTPTERAARKAERQTMRAQFEASRERIRKQQAETRAIVATGKCPACGGGLKRNLSLAGWWQCEQLGAVGFRKDSTRPSCEWQGFTE